MCTALNYAVGGMKPAVYLLRFPGLERNVISLQMTLIFSVNMWRGEVYLQVLARKLCTLYIFVDYF